jgi:hypothetical protein
VTLIVDAAPLILLADRKDKRWRLIQRILEEEPGKIILPADGA